MNENAVRIQIAMSALEGLHVPATENNTEKLTVIWQMLRQARDELNAAPEIRMVPEGGPEAEEDDHGAAEAE